MKSSNRFFELVINEIFDTLKDAFEEEKTINNLEKLKKWYPKFISKFEKWFAQYWNMNRESEQKNITVFDINKEQDYYKAIITFISGMTDKYAMDVYNEIIRF